jgi:hypothetical protein
VHIGQLVDTACSLMHHLCPPIASFREDDQLALPLRQKGSRFQRMTAQEAVTACLSVTALAQVAIREGPSDLRPFDGPKRPLFQSLRETLHDAAAGLWPEERRELSFPDIRKVLLSAYHQYLHLAAAGTFQALLERLGTARHARHKSQARLCSCSAHQSLSLHLSGHAADGRSSHHPRHCPSEFGAALVIMLRLQPPFILKMEWLRAGAGGAFLERSDMLFVLRNAGMLVTDVSVFHPDANSLVQWAAHQLALQPLPGTHRLHGAGGQVADGSFFPLSMESSGAWDGPRYSFCKAWPPPQLILMLLRPHS